VPSTIEIGALSDALLRLRLPATALKPTKINNYIKNTKKNDPPTARIGPQLQ
jgi:hypothetical protein